LHLGAHFSKKRRVNMIITEIYPDGSKQDFEGEVIRENQHIVVIRTKDGIREILKKRLPPDFKVEIHPSSTSLLT